MSGHGSTRWQRRGQHSDVAGPRRRRRRRGVRSSVRPSVRLGACADRGRPGTVSAVSRVHSRKPPPPGDYHHR